MLSPYVYQHLGTAVTKELKVPPDADPVPWEIRTVNICDQYHTSRRVFPEISSCSQSQGTCASTAQAAWNPLVHASVFPPPSVVRSSSYLFLEDTGTFYWLRYVLVFLLLSTLSRPLQTAQGGGHRTLLYGHAILLRHSNSGMVSCALPSPVVGKGRAAVPFKIRTLLSPPTYKMRSSLKWPLRSFNSVIVGPLFLVSHFW